MVRGRRRAAEALETKVAETVAEVQMEVLGWTNVVAVLGGQAVVVPEIKRRAKSPAAKPTGFAGGRAASIAHR